MTLGIIGIIARITVLLKLQIKWEIGFLFYVNVYTHCVNEYS